MSTLYLICAGLFPILSGFGMSLLCPMTNTAGSEIPARPPGYVFGIVWTILYILIGASWVLASMKNTAAQPSIWVVGMLFFALCLLLSAWVYLYSCNGNKKAALYTIPMAMLVTIWLLIILPDLSKLLLAPLIVWLAFAFALNFYEVNTSADTNGIFSVLQKKS